MSTEVADVLITSSRPLYNKKKTVIHDRPIYLVRNGVDDAIFKHREYIIPKDLPKGKPIIGYTGAIAYWLNWGMIDQLPMTYPQYDFVFVGPEYGVTKTNEMRRRKGIYFLGYKDIKQIPDYINSFNVCMIPFAKNKITIAADPIKMYEYLAMGKPVVVMDLPEMLRYGSVAYVAPCEKTFIKMIDRAVKEYRPEFEQNRLKIASENTWKHRVDMLEEIFERHLRGKKGREFVVPKEVEKKPEQSGRQATKILCKKVALDNGMRTKVVIKMPVECTIGLKVYKFARNGVYELDDQVFDILSRSDKIKEVLGRTERVRHEGENK